MKRVEAKCVMLAYGGASLKRTGLYDKVKAWLEESGKTVIDFGGIMANPTYAKVQEGARIARSEQVGFILAVGGGSVIDCCKIVSAQAMMDEDVWDAWYNDHRMPTKFILGISDIVAGIETLSAAKNGQQRGIYNLQGQLVTLLRGSAKGLYIMDGQKYLVK